MQDRIDHAARQAIAARERAGTCGDASLREHWLYVAESWERLANTCDGLQKLRESSSPANDSGARLR